MKRQLTLGLLLKEVRKRFPRLCSASKASDGSEVDPICAAGGLEFTVWRLRSRGYHVPHFDLGEDQSFRRFPDKVQAGRFLRQLVVLLRGNPAVRDWTELAESVIATNDCYCPELAWKQLSKALYEACESEPTRKKSKPQRQQQRPRRRQHGQTPYVRAIARNESIFA